MRSHKLANNDVPAALMASLLAVDRAVRASDVIDDELRELICLRVSQINGCAYCVDMHTLDLRADGCAEDKITMLPVWREASSYTARERAALAWAERLTRVNQEGVDDDDFLAASSVFDTDALAHLTVAITAINSWNRIAIAFGFEPGHYRAGDLKRWLAVA